MCAAANRLLADDSLEERKRKKEEEEYRRLKKLEKVRAGEMDELNLLELAVKDWEKAEKIRRFADNMELKIVEVAEQEQKDKLMEWLKWARNKADWLDPLTDLKILYWGKANIYLKESMS